VYQWGGEWAAEGDAVACLGRTTGHPPAMRRRVDSLTRDTRQRLPRTGGEVRDAGLVRGELLSPPVPIGVSRAVARGS
jgi:hypothetical protein